MHWLALVTLALLLEYFVFVILVGIARSKCGIDGPTMVGDPSFERALRVQQNTAEQLILILPSMWLFALYVSPIWASILGTVFLIGRAVYCIGYRAEAKKRGRGFIIGFGVWLVLLFGSIYGVVKALLA
jgi:glutathione S-transferase